MENKVHLIAIARQKFEDRWLKAGDKFEADRDEAADLLAIKFAIIDRDFLNVDAKLDTAETRTKRAYRRRDMIAEE